MKKGSRRSSVDEMRQEYDLAALGPGVRGKYARRLKDKVLVALRPEVAEAFPTATAVNEALRAVIKARSVPRRASRPRKGQSSKQP